MDIFEEVLELLIFGIFLNIFKNDASFFFRLDFFRARFFFNAHFNF